MGYPELWVKLLFQYGPFALVVFGVFICEAKARSVLDKAGDNQRARRLYQAIYASVWGMIFLLVAACLVTFFIYNPPHKEYTICGKLSRFEGNEFIFSHPDNNLYLRRVIVPGGKYEYDWRIITQEKLPAGYVLDFTLQQSLVSESGVRDYRIHIEPEYYKGKVLIKFIRNQNRFELINAAGDTVELQQVAAVVTPSQPGFVERLLAACRDWLIPNAFAGGPQEDITRQMESVDPYVRRYARMELAKKGSEALPWIEETLQNPDISYFTRYGLIATLSQMEDLSISVLLPATVEAALEACMDNDQAMREIGRKFFVSLRSRDADTVLAEAIDREREQGGDSAATAVRVSRLALAEMEVLCNLGIQQKIYYRTPGQTIYLVDGIADFTKAWELQVLAVEEDQVYFAKALWEWGQLLHNQSVIEKQPDGSRNPDLVRAAQGKFEQFLNAITSSPNPDAYPDFEHEFMARQYVEDPVGKSLVVESQKRR